jgi:hypothetical protein
VSADVQRRCPSGREDCEIRVFAIEGRSAGEPDLVLQTYRRVGHGLDAPWGPMGGAVRLPCRYAERLAEVILAAAAGTAPVDAETGR